MNKIRFSVPNCKGVVNEMKITHTCIYKLLLPVSRCDVAWQTEDSYLGPLPQPWPGGRVCVCPPQIFPASGLLCSAMLPTSHIKTTINRYNKKSLKTKNSNSKKFDSNFFSFYNKSNSNPQKTITVFLQILATYMYA